MIFIGFNDEKHAYKGDQALREMHRDGSLTLYADAIITKDSSGKLAVREPAIAGPFGARTGLVTGSLVGLLGTPVAIAVDNGASGAMRAAFDLTRAGVGKDFVDYVREHLLAKPLSLPTLTSLGKSHSTPDCKHLGELFCVGV